MSYRCYDCKKVKDEEGQLLLEPLCRECTLLERDEKMKMKLEKVVKKAERNEKMRKKSREEVEFDCSTFIVT